MERVLGLTEDGVWSAEDQKAAKGFSAATAWEAYQSGALQRWKSKGLFNQGLSDGTDKEKKESEKTAKETQFQVKGVDEGAAWEKKYSGMTYSELRNAINDLEDGPEKDHATAYLPSTRLDYTKTLQKTKGELGMAIALKDEDQQLKKRLQVIEPGSEEAKQIIARRAEIYYQFGDLDDYIKRLQEDVWWLERDEKYKFINEEQDFAELSKTDPPFMDWTYVMANNPTKARRWENAAYLFGMPPVYNALNYDNLHLMKDDERAIFNYVYAKEGESAAKEYLDYLQYELNKRSAEFWNKGAADLTQKYPVFSHIIASLLSTPIALTGGKGLTDAAWQNIRNAVTGDDKPVDYNRDAMLAAQLSGTIRDTVSQDIEDAIGASDMDGETSPMNNGKFLAALYQLAMDMQDSAAVVELSKIHPAVAAVASGVMGDTAGTQAMLDAKRRGATDEKALKEALLSVFYDMLLDESKLGTVLKYGGSFLESMIN
jgi:hypothetical protein